MLKGKKILFTGLVKSNRDFEKILKNGAEIFFFPTIKIVEVILSKEENVKINNVSNYDYLILTSVNAVKYFFNNNEKSAIEINGYSLKVIAIGEKTKKAAEQKGLTISQMPRKSSSESLIEILSKDKIAGKKILITGSKISNPNLRKVLSKQGAFVDFIPVYNTVINDDFNREEIAEIRNSEFDVIVFTSPSTFINYLKLLNIYNVKSYFKKIKIAAIGPVTAKEIEKSKLEVSIQPNNFNIKSLINEIIKVFNNN